jgi:hypothetical protein
MGLSACAGRGTPALHGTPENFDSFETYSRLYETPPDQACEAAKRALMSQGYLVSIVNPTWIEGRKHFKPDNESHSEIMIRTSCLPEPDNAQTSLVFTTAVEDMFIIKKSSSSASLGLSTIGSISLPYNQNNDGIIKIGSKTVTTAKFYNQFFDLIEAYLPTSQKSAP